MQNEIGLCGVSEADHYANVCGCQGGEATHVIKFTDGKPVLEVIDRECISCGRIMSDRERTENHGRCEDCVID